MDVVKSDESPVIHLIMFAPDKWKAARKFQLFARQICNFKPKTFNFLDGVIGHSQKYSVLRELAERLTPTLQEDIIELENYGYSSVKRSRELAAIIETLFCELFSILDCMREVIRGVYPKYQGLPERKTSRLFSQAAKGKLDPRLPQPIVQALSEAFQDWFPKLRDIRLQVVHADVGNCRLDNEIVAYSCNNFNNPSNRLVVKDVFSDLSHYEHSINKLTHTVFSELYKTLEDKPTIQTCGFFYGYVYERKVSPQQVIDRHSGVCISFKWFEKSDRPSCPFAESCGAYAQAKQLD